MQIRTQNIKISVVMPVYNTGIFLKNSIDSIIKQSFKDYELICVDDASKDSCTLHLLSEFEKEYSFLKVLHLAESRGAAEARNIGFSNAKGTYVIFLDSDDEFDYQLLEIMHKRILEENADICCCGYEEFYEDEQGRHCISRHFPKEYLDVTTQAFCIYDLDETALTLWSSAPWKLFRKDFIQKNEIFFQTLSSSNDVYFSCMTAILAKRICYVTCNRPLIFYRQNLKTQISANRNPQNLLLAVKKLVKDLKARQLYDRNKEKIFVFLFEHAAYELRISNHREWCREFYNDLRIFVEQHGKDVLIKSENVLYFRENLLRQEYDSDWFKLTDDFLTQLENNAQILIDKLKGYDRIFLWGIGKRGKAFQSFCKLYHINLVGVTDKSNENIGDVTEMGFEIVDANMVLNHADIIIASNREIYYFLQKMERQVKCIDLSSFCPY